MRTRHIVLSVLVLLTMALGGLSHALGFKAESGTQIASMMPPGVMRAMAETSMLDDCEQCWPDHSGIAVCQGFCVGPAAVLGAQGRATVVVAASVFGPLIDRRSSGLVVQPEPHPPRPSILV